jgi:hypothetical protein
MRGIISLLTIMSFLLLAGDALGGSGSAPNSKDADVSTEPVSKAEAADGYVRGTRVTIDVPPGKAAAALAAAVTVQLIDWVDKKIEELNSNNEVAGIAAADGDDCMYSREDCWDRGYWYAECDAEVENACGWGAARPWANDDSWLIGWEKRVIPTVHALAHGVDRNNWGFAFARAQSDGTGRARQRGPSPAALLDSVRFERTIEIDSLLLIAGGGSDTCKTSLAVTFDTDTLFSYNLEIRGDGTARLTGGLSWRDLSFCYDPLKGWTASLYNFTRVDTFAKRWYEPLVDTVSDPFSFSIGATAEAESNAPAGPGYSWSEAAYDWVDIVGRGTPLPMGNDDNQVIPMPFAFEFYENTFAESLHVCSNGWASFTSTETSHFNSPLPSMEAPENLLAAFWDDLDPSYMGEIWWLANPESLIVSWIEVPHFYEDGSLQGSFTFQLIVRPGGKVNYQYNSVGNGYPTDEATVGIQNSDKTEGLEIAYNKPFVHDSLAVNIFYIPGPAVEITCDNLTPVICRGQNFYFSLTVDNRSGGDISGTLTFDGYSGYGCNAENVLVSIPRAKRYTSGETVAYYYFSVPNAAQPGPYSASIAGELSGYELLCCMNLDIVQCEPWRVGDNTSWGLVEVSRQEVALPVVTSLAQNYPNPFNSATTINYSLAEAGEVTLKIYNICGRLVETLVQESAEPGSYTVTWDASELSSGIYFYKVTAGDFTKTKRMMLVK